MSDRSDTDALDADASVTDAREGARLRRTAESVSALRVSDCLDPFGPDSFGGDEYRADGDVTSTERAAQAAREAAESVSDDPPPIIHPQTTLAAVMTLDLDDVERLAVAGCTMHTDVALALTSRVRLVESQRDLHCRQADRLEKENARLEAIIAGSTTPPTDEEIEAHHAAGGSWLIRGDSWARVEHGRSAEDAVQWCRPHRIDLHRGSVREWRWTALDASGALCARPVVPTSTVSR